MPWWGWTLLAVLTIWNLWMTFWLSGLRIFVAETLKTFNTILQDQLNEIRACNRSLVSSAESRGTHL